VAEIRIDHKVNYPSVANWFWLIGKIHVSFRLSTLKA
jgi:hypothetical protein